MKATPEKAYLTDDVETAIDPLYKALGLKVQFGVVEVDKIIIPKEKFQIED